MKMEMFITKKKKAFNFSIYKKDINNEPNIILGVKSYIYLRVKIFSHYYIYLTYTYNKMSYWYRLTFNQNTLDRIEVSDNQNGDFTVQTNIKANADNTTDTVAKVNKTPPDIQGAAANLASVLANVQGSKLGGKKMKTKKSKSKNNRTKRQRRR